MMRRFELQDLLPAGTVADRSRSEVLQGLTAASVGDAGAARRSGGVAGDANAAADNIGNLLQAPAKDVAEQISTLTSQITTLTSTQQTQTGVTQDNTQV